MFRILSAFCSLGLLSFPMGDPFSRAPITSLCAADEQIIFSCTLRRPAKIVSLCASRNFTRTEGYLQYRFGVPGNIELEFPGQRQATQQAFRYKHYFRAQVDMTSITFSVADFEYSVFDDYNGEEKPVVSQQGVTVTPTKGGKETTLLCKGRAKANYAELQDILPTEPQ